MCFLDLNSREQETLQPVHVINVDIQDNHEEATLGAFLICELCQCVSDSIWELLDEAFSYNFFLFIFFKQITNKYTRK